MMCSRPSHHRQARPSAGSWRTAVSAVVVVATTAWSVYHVSAFSSPPSPTTLTRVGTFPFSSWTPVMDPHNRQWHPLPAKNDIIYPYDTSCRQSKHDSSWGTMNGSSSSSSSSSSNNGKSSVELSAIAVPYQGDGSTMGRKRLQRQKQLPKMFEETAARSAVKALVWRVVAGSITFATSYSFSKSLAEAVAIVSSDFVSKSLTMFIGERLMNKSQAGRQSGSDDAKRSLVKALLWRLFAIVNTLAVAVFVSKDLRVASRIASVDAVFKTALMFGYERVWAKVQWGKVEVGL